MHRKVNLTGHKKTLYLTGAALFWLILWQLLAGSSSMLIPLPTPVSVIRSLLGLAGQGTFWLSIGGSLLRISIGFLAALVLGTAFALLSSGSTFFKTLTAPLLALIRSIPVASFTILVFLWISREKIPTVIAFLTVLPIVWANIETGAENTDRSLLEMAEVFGMSKRDMLAKIVIPGIRPYFTTSVAGGLGFAWKSGVAAEIICRTSNSLGSLLWASKSAVEYDEVFAETLVIVLLSNLLSHFAGMIVRQNRKQSPQEGAAH